MQVLVTGGSGNIGSATLRALTADGRHRVRALARRRPVVDEVDDASVSWLPVDVAHDDLDEAVAGVDAIVHLAWKFQPTHDPAETWRTNVIGTRRVLEAAARHGVGAVVVASSIAAYSPAPGDAPVDEDWPTDGTSPATYCREKAYNERILDLFESTHPDVRVVRIRPAFVFQRSAATEQRRIFGGPLLRPAFLDPRVVPLLPVPRGLRLQAVHAGDVARAIAAAVEREVTGAFNLAGPGILGRDELGELMSARTVEVPRGLVRTTLDLGWHTRVLPVPGDLLDALLDVPVLGTDRARAELAWEPQHTAAHAVEAMLSGAAAEAGSQMPPLAP